MDELGGIEDVDVALAVGRAGEPIGKAQIGLAEEHISALVLDGDERAQDGADRLRGDLAVGGLVFLGMLGHVVEHGAQILEVDQQELLVIGDAEHDVEHALLHVGEQV